MSRPRKSDSRLYTDWYDYAERDLAAARLLYKDPFTLLYSFFHCHQATEKALKGYLLYCNGYAPDGHNLVYLCKKVAEQIKEANRFFELCVDLNVYYIQARYPSDFKIEIIPEELSSFIDQISDLIRLLKNSLKQNSNIYKNNNKTCGESK